MANTQYVVEYSTDACLQYAYTFIQSLGTGAVDSLVATWPFSAVPCIRPIGSLAYETNIYKSHSCPQSLLVS